MNSHFWRSLEERADTPEFREWLHREFPPLASEWNDEISRRHFLKLMGASFALAGLGACTKQPLEKIVPYVKQPEEIIPGKALHFASAMTLGGYARGIIVESHEGRPTKIEGNPNHPASLGATDVFMQAAVLDLYDPDRSQTVLNAGAISTWENFLSALHDTLQTQQQSGGAGIRILTQTVTSPTLHEQLRAVLAQFPNARWHQWEPVNRDNEHEGARLAFGEVVDTIYHFDKADVIVSLGADFLGEGPAQLRYARDFTNGRRISSGARKMNRLYVAECTPTITGAMADHRFPMRESAIEKFASELAEAFAGNAAASPEIAMISHDLQSGRAIVVVGTQQPPRVHAIAHRMSARDAVSYIAPVEPEPANQLQSLRELVTDMSAGRVELLLMLGGNPAFDAPADFDFAATLDCVKLRVHLGGYVNETAVLCHWHVPEAHFLESWSDARAFDGTTSLVQPLIEPLFGGKTAHEFLATMLGISNPSSYEIVRDHWRRNRLDDNAWRAALQNGVIAGTTGKTRAVASVVEKIEAATMRVSPLEINFRADPSIYDGRFATNAWLQELPKPLTKLTWDNAVLISPQTASRLDLRTDDIVTLQCGSRKIEGAVFILPGHGDDAVTVHLGYGRSNGHIAANLGFNAYAIRTSDALSFSNDVTISKTNRQHVLATTQHHHSVEGRNILRVASLNDFVANQKIIRAMGAEPPRDESLYRPEEHQNKTYAWAMAIDLHTCIGCNACVIACVAENNIPVVGKEEVARGREMHWIRIDRYYDGAAENPATYFQPLPCMHCENAPCELVCPVAATVHDSEGLNVQVYNRCIGTRYCSNNCPYKVRRFNFLEYDVNQFESPTTLKLARNPNVTVRSRGVMEKCTYCVQRISAARIEAEKENRRIRDGEVVTACAQACPAEAIIFGDINDPNSHVSKLKKLPLNYSMLGELNTRPRTTYLARLTNRNT